LKRFLVYSSDGTFRRSTSNALRSTGQVLAVGSSPELMVAARMSDDVAVLVWDVSGFKDGAALTHALMSLIADLPKVQRIVAVTAPAPGQCLNLVATTPDGRSSFTLHDSPARNRLIETLAFDPSRTDIGARLLAALELRVGSAAWHTVSVMISAGMRHTTVKEVAAVLRLHPDTLTNRHRDEGSPPPKRLLRFALCLYAYALRSEGHSWPVIAQWCRAAKARGLREAVVRELGATHAPHGTAVDDRVIDAMVDGWLSREARAGRAAGRAGGTSMRRITHVASLFAFLLLASCGGTDAQATSADAVRNASGGGTAVDLPVAASPARDGDLVLGIATTGVVRSAAEGTLRAEVVGTVTRVAVAPGERVAAGAVLLTLDSRPFDLAVREAEIAVDDATLRFQDFLLGDSITQRASPDPAFRKVALTRSGLAAAQVRLERARFDREKATIVAPFAGVVDGIAVAVGERVAAGQELTRVVDVEGLRVEATVLEHDLPLLRVGGEAVVTSAAAPERAMAGRITAVLPRVDSAAKAGRAYVSVLTNSLLRPGMSVDVQLESTRLRGRRLVPASAVIERDGRPLVFVVKNGRAQWVYIRPGRSNGVETELLPDSASGRSPVSAGALVIVDGHLTLTHDAPVRVLSARNASRPSS